MGNSSRALDLIGVDKVSLGDLLKYSRLICCCDVFEVMAVLVTGPKRVPRLQTKSGISMEVEAGG
jgi:hypothetical protein